VSGTERLRRRPRREDAVDHAADLLRTLGPGGLTSSAVAERMGITQSGVYRHVRSMDELASLAAERIVAGLNETLQHLLSDPEMDWDEMADFDLLCHRLVQHMIDDRTSFEVVTRRRFAHDGLGTGIRKVIDRSNELIAALLEHRWRIEFGHEQQFGADDQAALAAHACAIHDDGLAIAELAFAAPSTPLGLDDVALILKHRLLAGWVSFVIDMNDRVGLAYPKIDLVRGIVAE